jgi:hypothetical protein
MPGISNPPHTDEGKPIPQTLRRDELLDLYKHYDNVINQELGFFFQYFNFYIGLVSAILVLSVTGLLNLDMGDERAFLLLVGPLLIIGVGRIGYSNIDTYYRRFTNAWVTKTNLERMLFAQTAENEEEDIRPPPYPSEGGSFIVQIKWPSIQKVFDDGIKYNWSAEQVAQALLEGGTTLSYARRVFYAYDLVSFFISIAVIIIALS